MAQLIDTTIDGRVAVAKLNRPDAQNALSLELMEQLASELERLNSDPEVRCVVIAGTDRYFASGADLSMMTEGTPAGVDHNQVTAFWQRFAALEKPVIAAVSGWALGAGCELAIACDMVVASETANFGLPEVTLGIIPGGGGTQRLARTLGKQRAMEFVLTGRRFDAQMGNRWGLVNLVTKKRDWLLEATELAKTVAERPPIAVRSAKQAILAADESSMSEGLAAERRLHEEAMATEDRVEGMQAFLEKREPNFRGR